VERPPEIINVLVSGAGESVPRVLYMKPGKEVVRRLKLIRLS